MNRRILPFQGWRLTMLGAVMFFAFLLLIGKLYTMQFVEGEEYVLQAE